MKVYVDSPHCLIREGLARLVAEHHDLADEADAEIAVRYLCSHTSSYPPPPVPTLALMCGSDTDVVEVLRLGYRGVFKINEGAQTLERAWWALLRGGN